MLKKKKMMTCKRKKYTNDRFLRKSVLYLGNDVFTAHSKDEIQRMRFVVLVLTGRVREEINYAKI